FNIKYLGVQKKLAQPHTSLDYFKSCGTARTPDPKYNYIGGKGIMLFPRPTAGPWEVRDFYVIEMERLPSFATGYCYGKRIIYFDKENYSPYIVDVWDSAGKLYKWFFTPMFPSALDHLGNDGQVDTWSGNATVFIANFLDSHATYFVGINTCLDANCAP